MFGSVLALPTETKLKKRLGKDNTSYTRFVIDEEKKVYFINTCSRQVNFHFVRRQSSSFIGADEVDAPERLDGGEAFNDGVLAGHAHHAEGKRHRHDDRQTFGNGGDSTENSENLALKPKVLFIFFDLKN